MAAVDLSSVPSPVRLRRGCSRQTPGSSPLSEGGPLSSGAARTGDESELRCSATRRSHIPAGSERLRVVLCVVGVGEMGRKRAMWAICELDVRVST